MHVDQRVRDVIQSREKKGEMYDIDWCRRRKPLNTHVPALLLNRELGMRPSGTHFMRGSREFHHCIAPKHTLNAVDKKRAMTIRRFTPDGKRMICFSISTLFVYDYLGVQNAQDATTSDAFEKVFQHKFTLPVLTREEVMSSTAMICKEYCLITPDSKHLILLKSKISDEIGQSVHEIFQNNETLLNSTATLDSATNLLSIDLEKGVVCSQVRVDFDRLINFHVVHLVERTLTVLSVQQQTIHIYKVEEATGNLTPLMNIGYNLYDDDALHLDHYDRINASKMSEKFFTGFKQRVLSFLYREMKSKGKAAAFLHQREFFDSLRMAKIQMLGSYLILIRLMPAHYITARTTDYTTQNYNYMFVIFDWRIGEVHKVYSKGSKELFDLYERNNELFKNGTVIDNHFPTSIEYCSVTRATHEKTKASFLAARGEEEMRRRMLFMLPYPAPQYPAVTPYLDPLMFSFDEKSPGIFERAKLETNNTNTPTQMRFHSTRTNKCAFVLNVEAFKQSTGPIVVLFHPTDPFIIIFEKNQTDSSVTFQIPNHSSTLQL